MYYSLEFRLALLLNSPSVRGCNISVLDTDTELFVRLAHLCR